MNFIDLVNLASAIIELVNNVSELPHMDKMPDMLFFFGLNLNSNKTTEDKNKQK
ncbi:hypothetical protein [Priestia megaterium]|uniref:hypothetical protein n=1 Tax=Priestia megaterium TaxID=1404 RepID=UPI0039A35CE3